VRLHVSFHLWDDKPARARVTAGGVCERKVWRQPLERGATDVGDRYFAADYKLFAELEQKGCRFLLRLRDEAIVQPEAELPLRPEDRAARVSGDAGARLVTNIPPTELSAAEVGALYRRRWQIEGFFRWIKCILGCRHWLAERERGATLQLYLALIAGLMLHLLLGRRPNQRLMERLRFYLLGWASAEELARATVQALNPSAQKS
jgi:IS4 transposase